MQVPLKQWDSLLLLYLYLSLPLSTSLSLSMVPVTVLTLRDHVVSTRGFNAPPLHSNALALIPCPLSPRSPLSPCRP
jgi:hypothetical protein